MNTPCTSNKKNSIIKIIKETLPDHKSLQKYKKIELCELIAQDCKSLDGPIWQNNSCYLDSFIVGMFHFDNNKIVDLLNHSHYNNKDTHLYEISRSIKQNIISIHKTIINGDQAYCTDLRNLLSQFDRYYDKNVKKIEMIDWKSSQLEPADLIHFLNRCFKIPNNVEVYKEFYGTNKLKRILLKKDKTLVYTRKISSNFAAVMIPVEDLFSMDQILLKKYLPKNKSDAIFDEENLWKPTPHPNVSKNDNKTNTSILSYRRKIEKTTFLEAPCFFIHIPRKYPGMKLTTPLYPLQKIKLKNNKYSLYLRSIIVHHGGDSGGHYTVYIRCKNDWYHYNDMFDGKKVKHFGSFDDILKYRDGYILKNCTNLVYA